MKVTGVECDRSVQGRVNITLRLPDSANKVLLWSNW